MRCIAYFCASLVALFPWEKLAATSFLPNRLDIKQISDAPAACLPKDGQRILLQSAYTMENTPQTKSTHRWKIEHVNDSKAKTLHPGECVIFGKPIDGYQQSDTLKLEDGKTYVFVLERGDRQHAFSSSKYVGAFCVSRTPTGERAYLPYLYHQDGTVTYPSCGRYIGHPPAADGIVPPDMP